jgi:hypothetical protein
MDESDLTRIDRPRSTGVLIGFFVFCLISIAILNLPSHPDAIQVRNFLRLPLEAVGLGLLVLLFPAWARRLLIWLLALFLGLILFLKLADIGTQAAFQRPFNPYLDIKMLQDGWNLMSGSLGATLTFLVILGAFCVLIGIIFSLKIAMERLGEATGSVRLVLAGTLAVVGLAGGIALFASQSVAGRPLPIVEAQALPYLSERLSLIAASIEDMHRFERQLTGADTVVADKALFQAVKGRDVILIFVESYGRSALEDPRYAPIIRPRLARMTQELEGSGYSMASTWVGSPTVGGLSWLAHGTFLSGLWLDSQSRYDRLMISERQSLNSLFSQAGWESVAVMPAITMDWPEAAWYGYDRLLAHKDLDYRGLPFNWVTMPDQYTLSQFQRMVRDQPARKPVMAEIALISSHAPWTPVASLVDWDLVGDGTIFDAQARAGETPTQVWADPEKVRTHYIGTIDYSLSTLNSYIDRYGDDALFLIIGDHQPAAIITGSNASRAVPLHVLSRDRALIERFTALGFKNGLVPGKTDAEMPMDQMRELLVNTLSTKD